ncbi:MAG TPA: LamG-like jellyroll fold domain-containing protein, partial [Kofleriaceae bacterium]|nr:LamG-like jellyroll fold domain-containing protein [Kofleriaceae bacterium]
MGSWTDRSAACVCVCVLIAGCNQSLFDSSPDDPDSAGDGDGGVDDGDGGAGSVCSEPCEGDAVADFDDAQGGANGRWTYLLDLGSVNGASYEELSFGTWGDLPAWSAGDDGPAIASCDGQDAPACDGLGDALLLVPAATGSDRPALTWTAPSTASYRLSATVRRPDGAPTDVPVQILVSRAGRHDAVIAQVIDDSSPGTTELSALIPTIAGDELIVSVDSSEDDPPPLGLRLQLTSIPVDEDNPDPEAFPGSCLMALRFDEGGLDETCRDVTVEDVDTAAGDGPNETLGQGRTFLEGQYLVVGNTPLDFSDDFTIQFWAKVTEPQPSFDTVPYSDAGDAISGGVGFYLAQETATTYFYFEAHGPDEFFQDIATTRPTDGEWHFWRATRSTGNEKFTFC